MTETRLFRILDLVIPACPALGRDRGRQAGEFICNLACLREAPPPEALRRAGPSAKAGTWNLVLPRYCLMLIRVKMPARPKRRVGIQQERRGGKTPDFPKDIKM